MNAPLPRSKFGKKFQDNFDSIFNTKPCNHDWIADEENNNARCDKCGAVAGIDWAKPER